MSESSPIAPPPDGGPLVEPPEPEPPESGPTVVVTLLALEPLPVVGPLPEASVPDVEPLSSTETVPAPEASPGIETLFVPEALLEPAAPPDDAPAEFGLPFEVAAPVDP
jgi:hypothetical protein